MLTKRYLTSVKNLPAIMQQIIKGTAPEKFTQAHLRSIGFGGSNDRAIIPLFKDLDFLSPDGVPTPRYHEYRDKSKSKEILAIAIKEMYEEIFHINEKPTDSDRAAIQGKFKSVHNVSDRVAEQQTTTFFALLKLADLDAISKTEETETEEEEEEEEEEGEDEETSSVPPPQAFTGLRYNIEIHLPPSKDIEVYNAIFKALKEHLLDA